MQLKGIDRIREKPSGHQVGYNHGNHQRQYDEVVVGKLEEQDDGHHGCMEGCPQDRSHTYQGVSPLVCRPRGEVAVEDRPKGAAQHSPDE